MCRKGWDFFEVHHVFISQKWRGQKRRKVCHSAYLVLSIKVVSTPPSSMILSVIVQFLWVLIQHVGTQLLWQFFTPFLHTRSSFILLDVFMTHRVSTVVVQGTRCKVTVTSWSRVNNSKVNQSTNTNGYLPFTVLLWKVTLWYASSCFRLKPQSSMPFSWFKGPTLQTSNQLYFEDQAQHM